ncbi:hypothetical protein HD600_002091 [Microbacterium ginsengiterrae]|uniref:Uncharacterized protein n=1 Tax=Microbacterium ginsengiterrae TaxID=546115 RepID=A0A7W9FDR7_9MICO|nr:MULTISPECIES: hypothetical protein [Microbacterium]MBB5743594.1 hypothetical protein [Microbacterium ginsengiterrae]
MTMITPAPVNTTPGRVQWSEVDVDLWVAHVDGAFGGSIDSAGERHVARDPFGRDRGEFETFDQARRHIEAFLDHPAMSRHFHVPTVAAD